MKVCEYCGSEVTDDVMECENCGSKEFKNIYPDYGVDQVIRKQEVTTYISINISDDQMPYKKKKKSGCVTAIIVFLILFVISLIVSTLVAYNIATEKATTAQKDLSDMEIVTLEGHPKFYGDYEKAESFWKEYKKVKVVNSRQTINNEDALLMITSSDEDNGVITNVSMNFSNSNELKQKLTVNDVLKVVYEYIPYDIIDKYYTFNESFHEKLLDGDYEAYHYVMTLNEQGKAVNKSGKTNYEDKFAFKIIHRNGDDWLAEINYLAYEGNHDKAANNKGKYKVEKWNVGLSKLKN